MIERILQIIDFKGINKSKFYKETGLSNGFLDKVRDIGASKIEYILNSYPEINPEWLLTGKGEMLKSEIKSAIDAPNPIRDKLIARQDQLIEKLEKENKELQNQISELKKAQENPSGYGMGAESKSKLKK